MSNTHCQAKSASPIAQAISELEDALHMAGLEMVGESDPLANNGETHASPAHMVGYMSVAIRAALQQLQAVRS